MGIIRLKNRAGVASVAAVCGKKEYDGKRIILLKTSQVRITTEQPIAWTLDGEYGGEHQSVHMNVLSRSIDICSPTDNIMFERTQEPSLSETTKE